MLWTLIRFMNRAKTRGFIVDELGVNVAIISAIPKMFQLDRIFQKLGLNNHKLNNRGQLLNK
ncbi:hypothetical protein [Virgibacillus sp. CBA3643]|uniref:hypothetical protein n=1 Tax=Virgibacillus sp. CBA3643 TaxID=2942278 RepID=UPI0035A2621B